MSRVSKRVQRAVLERAGGRCEAEGCNIDVVALAGMPRMYLDKVLPKGASAYEIDHRDPFGVSGDNRPANLQVLCGNCHHDKSTGEREAGDYRRGERSHTLDRVQPRPGSQGIDDRLGRVLRQRLAQAGL